MTTNELREPIADGETLCVEFEGEPGRPLSDREVYEAVVGLASTDGGTLLIGVEDDGTVTGARPRHPPERYPQAPAPARTGPHAGSGQTRLRTASHVRGSRQPC